MTLASEWEQYAARRMAEGRTAVVEGDEEDHLGVMDDLDFWDGAAAALAEAYVERLHPRDRLGKWREILGITAAVKAKDSNLIRLPQGRERERFVDDLGLARSRKERVSSELAQEILYGARDTKELHSTGGEYEPDRQKLHAEAVAATLAEAQPQPPGKRRVLFLAGGNASGKSRALGLPENEERLPPDAATINFDNFKEKLPEYRRLSEAHDPAAVDVTHAESADMAAMAQAEAIKAGLNVVIDQSGASARFEEQLRVFKDAGYQVDVILVDAPLEAAEEASLKRGVRTGRYIPLPVLRRIHRRSIERHLEWRDSKLIDSWRAYRRVGKTLVPVASGGGGKHTVEDAEAYKLVLAKAGGGQLREIFDRAGMVADILEAESFSRGIEEAYAERLHPRGRTGRWIDVPDFVRSLGLSRVHVVGGAVRDELLGKRAKDHDFIVLGQGPGEIKDTLSPHGRTDDLVVAGRHVGVRLYPDDPDARELAPDGIEFVPPRTERSIGAGHKDFEIVADASVPFEEDARRRDFTVNAVARDLDSGELLDPLGGAQDAREGVLRVIGPRSFQEDPLRIVRGLRFISQHDLNPDEETLAQMRKYAPQVAHLSGERVGMEMDKLLLGDNPRKALRIARDTGVLAHLFPEFAPAIGFEQKSRFHDLTADEHIFGVVQAMADNQVPLAVRWAGFFHDTGKPESAWMGDDGRLHYYENRELGKQGHEVIGARKAGEALDRLAYLGRDERERVVAIVRAHMFRDHNSASEPRARQFIAKHGDLVQDLIDMKRADTTGKESDVDEKIGQEPIRLAAFEEQVNRTLAAGEPTQIRDLAVNGNDLIALGYTPGPSLGAALQRLLRHVIGDPSLNTPEWLGAEALRMLKDGTLAEAYVEREHLRDRYGRWRDMPKFVLAPLGGPGSGKGTVGKLLAKHYNVPHVSAGDMLRALPRDSALGKQVFPLIEKGEFVPDHLISEMVGERLRQPDVREGVVLDGFPRRQGQADFLEATGAPVTYVELALDKEVAVQRLLKRAEIEGRSDDTPDVIQNRFAVHEREAEPMMARLRHEGKMVTVEMSPDSPPESNATWARWAIEQSGARFAREELVAKALQSWVGWPSDMRIHMQDEITGEPEPTGAGKDRRTQARVLLEEIRERGRPNDRALYRGVSHGHEPHVDLPASWSESRAVARKWAGRDGQVLVLKKGEGFGLRMADYIESGQNVRERQWLILPQPLREAYEERLHPRNRLGQWRDVPDLLQAAFHDIVGNRVYRDAKGDYRYRKGNKPGGPVAPWSDAAREAFPEHLDLVRAANEAIRPMTLPGARRVVPREGPELYPPSSFLTLPKSGKLRGPALHALKAVDSVLRIPKMHGPIPVRATAGKNTRGGFTRRSAAPGSFEGWQGPTLPYPGRKGVTITAKRAAEIEPNDEIVDDEGHRYWVTWAEEIGGMVHVTRKRIAPWGVLEEERAEYGPDDLVGFFWKPPPVEEERLYPESIKVSAFVSGSEEHSIEGTLIHELAHYIDNQAFMSYRAGRGMGSLHAAWATRTPDEREQGRKRAEGQPHAGALEQFEQHPAVLADWYQAVTETDEYKKLGVASMMEAQTHKYLRSPTELWARSFAQWVAIRSGNPRLMKWLRSVQNQPKTITRYRKTFRGESVPYETERPASLALRQWQDESFAPVAAAMDRLFAGLGWLK